MEIAALCVISLALGVVSGYAISAHHERHRDTAPLPEYDPANPMNARARETVEMGGATWYRVQ